MFLVVAAKQKHMSPYTSSSVCYMLDENTLKSVQRLQNICTLDARKSLNSTFVTFGLLFLGFQVL